MPTDGKQTAVSVQETAQSLQRVEYKYLLQPQQVPGLCAKLEQALQADEYGGPQGYKVKSLYFDTPQNRDFAEAVDGVFARQKIRLRLYDEADEEVKLECKMKRGQYQRKVSIPLSREKAQLFIKGDRRFLLAMDSEEAHRLYLTASAGYRPVSMVEYRRKAFVWPQRNTRIALDSSIRGSTTNLDLFNRALPLTPVFGSGTTVLEVKYEGRLEPFLRDILQGYTKVRQSVSKYANGRLAAYWNGA